MSLGDCIKFIKPGLSLPHCYFVIAENASGECVIVNMTTLGHICDKTVILRVGDHPQVKHDSIILYGDAQITSHEDLDTLARSGLVVPKEPCSPELLKKLQDGIAASKETKSKILKFCKYLLPKK